MIPKIIENTGYYAILHLCSMILGYRFLLMTHPQNLFLMIIKYKIVYIQYKGVYDSKGIISKSRIESSSIGFFDRWRDT